MKSELEVGDKIKIENALGGVRIVEIARVTKTMAMTAPTGSGYEMRFRIKTFMGSPRLVNREKWSTTQYTIIS